MNPSTGQGASVTLSIQSGVGALLRPPAEACWLVLVWQVYEVYYPRGTSAHTSGEHGEHTQRVGFRSFRMWFRFDRAHHAERSPMEGPLMMARLLFLCS